MEKEINVVALVKGKERFVFLYDDERRGDTLRMLGRYAADPDLNFSWYDAAILSQRIRQSAPPASTEAAARHDDGERLFDFESSPFDR